jgi:hypothetical protein
MTVSEFGLMVWGIASWLAGWWITTDVMRTHIVAHPVEPENRGMQATISAAGLIIWPLVLLVYILVWIGWKVEPKR